MMSMRWALFSLIVLGLCSSIAHAGQCTRFSSEVAEKLRALMRPGELWLQYCEPCGQETPYSLHIESVEFVQDTAQPRHMHEGTWYTYEDIVERRVPGMDETTRRLLIDAQAQRPVHSVTIQGRRVDLAYLYRPAGNDRYRNLGVELGCGDSSELITYSPPDRAAEQPSPEVAWADISEQCYDGCCIRRDPSRFTLTTRRAASLLGQARADAPAVATLGTHRKLKLLRLLAHVSPIRATAIKDHGIFRKGDTFYLLNSLGEGFFRVWHYGEVHRVGMTGLSSFYTGTNVKSRCTPEKKGCWAEATTHYGHERWWGEVVTEDGTRGWLADIEKAVTGLKRCD